MSAHKHDITLQPTDPRPTTLKIIDLRDSLIRDLAALHHGQTPIRAIESLVKDALYAHEQLVLKPQHDAIRARDAAKEARRHRREEPDRPLEF